MSQQTASSTATAGRTANAPTVGNWAWGSWVYLPTLDASIWPLFIMRRGGVTEHGHLRWRGDLGGFRIGHALDARTFSSSPTGNQWVYFYVRDNGTNLQAGWKDIDDVAFTDAASFTSFADSGNNPTAFDIGANIFSTSVPNGVRFFRTSVWNEPVTNANLLLAAATDLGYTTNLNTHLPLTQGIGSPWADTSGNARDWTSGGTFSDAVDPSLGGGGGIPKTTRLALMGVG